jgi:hypothetical protein
VGSTNNLDPAASLAHLDLGAQKDQLRILVEGEADYLLMTIENFNRQFRVGEKGGCYAMLHAFLYLRAAQFEGLSAEASYRLQKVGGMVLGMVK